MDLLVLKQTTKVKLFDKGSLHMLDSDINCSLKKINEIKERVRKLSKNFIWCRFSGN